MDEPWNGIFVYALDNKHELCIMSIIFPYMVSLETTNDTWKNSMYLTVIYSLFSFVMFAADHIWPYLFTFLFCGRYYSCKMTFLSASLQCCYHQGGLILYVTLNILLMNPQPVVLSFRCWTFYSTFLLHIIRELRIDIQ